MYYAAQRQVRGYSWREGSGAANPLIQGFFVLDVGAGGATPQAIHLDLLTGWSVNASNVILTPDRPFLPIELPPENLASLAPAPSPTVVDPPSAAPSSGTSPANSTAAGSDGDGGGSSSNTGVIVGAVVGGVGGLLLVGALVAGGLYYRRRKRRREDSERSSPKDVEGGKGGKGVDGDSSGAGGGAGGKSRYACRSLAVAR